MTPWKWWMMLEPEMMMMKWTRTYKGNLRSIWWRQTETSNTELGETNETFPEPPVNPEAPVFEPQQIQDQELHEFGSIGQQLKSEKTQSPAPQTSRHPSALVMIDVDLKHVRSSLLEQNSRKGMLKSGGRRRKDSQETDCHSLGKNWW